MNKVAIFTVGAVTGILAVPASVIYIKPVRIAFAYGLSRLITSAIVNDPKARETAHEAAERIVKLHDKYFPKEGTQHG